MLAGFASLALRPCARFGGDSAPDVPEYEDSRGTRIANDSDAESDPLFHEVSTTVYLQQTAAAVLEAALDVGQWKNFMPCCSQSEFLRDVGGGRSLFRVHFGLKIHHVFIGDDVIYEVYQPAPDQLTLRSMNNESLTYVESIQYH